MKQILIFAHTLEIGGAERALLGLLESFDYTKYSIDLFLMRHEGELLNMIPEEVHLLPEIKQYTGLAVPLISIVKKGMWDIAYGRLRAKLKAQKYVKEHQIDGDNGVELEYSHKYTLNYMPIINKKNYDLAISFLTPHYFVANKVNAKRKLAWIHTDYSKMQVDVLSETSMWDAYDYIASISEAVTDNFLETFPGLRSKIVLIENILPTNLIKMQSEAFVASEMTRRNDNINLLTIGRYCYQKNFENIPDICSKLHAFGLNVKWFIIGFGGDEMLIRKKIKESHMEEFVILLGKKDNPYPYLQACDLYVQPSRYEGKSITVREAQLLAKPVVITDYATSSSQLENNVDGVIIPIENEQCAKGIEKLLNNKKKMFELSEQCKKRDYSNKEEIEKLYLLIDDKVKV